MTEESRSLRRHSRTGILLRGCAMGAADIVPGVSGGTIAFITGIYLRLLAALSNIPSAVICFIRQRRFWQLLDTVDAGFLLLLFTGILISVFGLAHAIGYLLAHHSILVWAFFFGLIIGAIWHVGRQIGIWSAVVVGLLLIGALVAWGLTLIVPASLSLTPLIAFGAGAIAISAMILPGISGSFILVLMGLYAPVLAAVRSFELLTMASFGAGCAVGLIAFSKLVSRALRCFPNATIALLTGFMIGALNNVWPWQVTTSWRTRSDGSLAPLVQDNVTPFVYAQTTGEPHQLGYALLLAFAGLLLVVVLERVFESSRRQSNS